MTKFSNNPRALGICDRCGTTCRLNSMVNQIVDRKPSGVRVCVKCNDIDQEQLQAGTLRIADAFALRNPRPDVEPGREPLTPTVLPQLIGP